MRVLWVATATVVLMLVAPRVHADFQSGDPAWQTVAGGKLAFEVASVRLSKPGTFQPPSFPLSVDDSYAETGGIFSADFPLEVYISFAYKLQPTSELRSVMLAQLPKWVATDRYLIHARAAGSPTKDQMRLMMQSLLAERFNLKVHFETQDKSVLALMMVKPGKLGPRLHLHSEGPACRAAGTASDVFPPVCDVFMAHMTVSRLFEMGSRNTTLQLIAGSLSTMDQVSRTIVDQTGLEGRYDFSLTWSPEPGSPTVPPDWGPPDQQGPGFATALKDQLGLKVVNARAPQKLVVIDHIERPSEN